MIAFTRFWALEFSAGGGPLTRGISQRPGAVIAYFAQRLGWDPNVVTTAGLMLSLLASLVYLSAPATLGYGLLCLLIYLLAYSFDCADGQLARARGLASEFGAWWDITADAIQILFLSFAVLYWLAAKTGGLNLAILLCAAALAIGRVLVLYSSKFTRLSGGEAAAGPRGARHPVKWLLWLIVDTPTFLLGICLLRDLPVLLASYILGMGLAFGCNAGYLGLTKLRRG